MNSRLADLFARRSIRKYTDQYLGDDLLNDVLEAAMAAPSAQACDPWHFVVVRNPKVLASLAESLENGRHVAHAAAGIVCCVDPAKAKQGRFEYAIQDGAAAMTQLLLAASILGLGACWSELYPFEDRVSSARALLKIPNAVLPFSIAALGWPAQRAEPRTRFRASAVHTERW